MDKMNIGLIGIVGDLAKADFWGTMQSVAQIGYRGIEGGEGLLALTGDPSENLKRFHDLGLRILTVSASRESLRTNLDKIIADAHALQSPRVSVWWAACDSRDNIMQDAELYNAAGKYLKDEGMTLCYHNHAHEFRNVFDGVNALDILAMHTDPNCVAFELDIAWVAVGGENPVTVLKKLAGRVPAIHIKDVYSVTEKDAWTAVGTGVVDIHAAMQTAIELGIEWGVVEQDRLRHLTPMETINVSYLNLKESGLAN